MFPDSSRVPGPFLVSAPEPLARHQNDVTGLTADETAVYWVAESPGKGGVIYMLPLAEKR